MYFRIGNILGSLVLGLVIFFLFTIKIVAVFKRLNKSEKLLKLKEDCLL